MKTYQQCGVSKMAIVKWLKDKYVPDPKLDPESQDTDPRIRICKQSCGFGQLGKGEKRRKFMYQDMTLGLGLMVGESGVQLAGQTSPCFSTNWKAFRSLQRQVTRLIDCLKERILTERFKKVKCILNTFIEKDLSRAR
jgi:hypothetical protein